MTNLNPDLRPARSWLKSFRAMKSDVRRWLREHPIKSRLFTLAFVVGPIWIGFNEELLLPGIIVAFLGAIACGWVVERDLKGPLGVIVAGAVLLAPAHGHAQTASAGNAAAVAAVLLWEELDHDAAGIGVGVGLLCVGVCTYYVAKFCQKHMPRKSKTNELFFAGASTGDDYGASWNYGALGSCVPTVASLTSGGDDDAVSVTFVIDVLVEENGARVGIWADRSGWQTWPEFQAEMAAEGLVVTGLPDNSQFFARNKTPCPPEEVPITFDLATKSVRHDRGGELRRIVIERSPDLREWYPLLATQESVGARFQVKDTTREGQAFYRVLQP